MFFLDCSRVIQRAPRLVLGALRLVPGTPRSSQACGQHSQTHRQCSQVFPGAPKGHCIGPVNSGIWPPWDSGLATLRHSQKLLVTKIHFPEVLISNNTLLVIGKETKSTVPDDFKVSLLSDNPPFKLLVVLLEACLRPWEASWIWALHLSIIIRFLPNIIDHILGWRWEDVIQRKVVVATAHRRLGTRCAVSLLAMMNDAKKCWVVEFNRHLYPTGSRILIDDLGHITGVRPTLSIRRLPAAPKLSDFPAGIWQTNNCSIHNWQNGPIDNWCNHQKYRFIIPRPVPWE